MEITAEQEQRLLETIDFRTAGGQNEKVIFKTIQFALFGKIEDIEIRSLSTGLHGAMFRNNLNAMYREMMNGDDFDYPELNARIIVLQEVVKAIFEGTSRYSCHLDNQEPTQFPNFVLMSLTLFQSKEDKKIIQLETKDELMTFNQKKEEYISASVFG